MRLYSLYSLRRRGATASVHTSVDYIHIKRHGMWRSDSFWDYTVHIRDAVSVAGPDKCWWHTHAVLSANWRMSM